MGQTVATLHLPDKALPALPFVRVLPEEINAHWAFIERGLNIVRARCKEPWKADDVLQHLVDERAALYRRDDGFVVMEQCNEPISGRRYLNVWVMWFMPNRARPIRRELLAWLDAMKAAHDAEWIEFSSPLEGWLGIEPDFVRHRVIWRRS